MKREREARMCRWAVAGYIGRSRRPWIFYDAIRGRRRAAQLAAGAAVNEADPAAGWRDLKARGFVAISVEISGVMPECAT